MYYYAQRSQICQHGGITKLSNQGGGRCMHACLCVKDTMIILKWSLEQIFHKTIIKGVSLYRGHMSFEDSCSAPEWTKSYTWHSSSACNTITHMVWKNKHSLQQAIKLCIRIENINISDSKWCLTAQQAHDPFIKWNIFSQLIYFMISRFNYSSNWFS